MPPTISVPKGQSTITVREGSRAELQCEVRGKPKPPIIWSRVDKETPMPSGMMTMETYDGKLHLESVSREMSGTYKCQTARYNGFNIRPREALVQLNVQCEYNHTVLEHLSECLCAQKPVGWAGLTRLVLLSRRVDLSYWAEQTHLFCLETFEQLVFNCLGYTRLRAGYTVWPACCKWKGEVLCVFVRNAFLSPTSGWVQNNSFTAVCLCALHICKIPSGYVSRVVSSKGSELMLIRLFPPHNLFFNLVTLAVISQHAWTIFPEKQRYADPNMDCVIPNGFHAVQLWVMENWFLACGVSNDFSNGWCSQPRLKVISLRIGEYRGRDAAGVCIGWLSPSFPFSGFSLQRSECLLSSHAVEVCFDAWGSVLSPLRLWLRHGKGSWVKCHGLEGAVAVGIALPADLVPLGQHNGWTPAESSEQAWDRYGAG